MLVVRPAPFAAGKTVVAEYCFAMALRDGQRVIYTSPLKARALTLQYVEAPLRIADCAVEASCR